MRQKDVARLSQPYPSSGGSPDDRFGEALGLTLTNVRALANEIASDLDATAYGIGWWKAYEPQFGVRARILVSDVLRQNAESIATNLVDAKLHQLGALNAWEHEPRIPVTIDEQGEPHMVTPPRTRGLDDLPSHLAKLHTAGFFRGIASAFDCLGACIIGVLALPHWIAKASLGEARGKLKNLSTDASQDVERKRFRDDFNALVDASGPPGWLPWALDYRHMLVHRARRFEMFHVLRESWVVPGKEGIGHGVLALARDPARSDVEVWRAGATEDPVLTESAETTVAGILESSLTTIEGAAKMLLDLWTWRKANVSTLVQPAVQWENGKKGNTTGFMGYMQGELPYAPEQMAANPADAFRLRVASVDTTTLKNWPDFGGAGDNK